MVLDLKAKKNIFAKKYLWIVSGLVVFTGIVGIILVLVRKKREG